MGFNTGDVGFFLSGDCFFVGFNTGDVGFNTGETWASPCKTVQLEWQTSLSNSFNWIDQREI